MALAERIKVTTATTGTGALTLSATGVRDATNGDCLSPAESGKLANRVVSYYIVSGANFAFGNGLISSNGLSLTRDPFEQSWNGTTFQIALLSLTGTSIVTVSPVEDDLNAGSIGLTSAITRGCVTL